MPSYSGTSLWTTAAGGASQPCPCRLDFDDEGLTLLPGTGSPLSFDLGDIEQFLPQDYELRLKLFTGEGILLSKFGKTFQDLCHDLQEAYRKRLVKCLLLDDLDEISRFDGTADFQTPGGGFSAPSELRLYQSNLAVLPQGQTGFQWRLVEIDNVRFDDSRYAVVLRSGEEALSLTKLAKRTREFMEKLQAAMDEVASRSAATVRSVFPFLTPEQFRRAAELLKEGRVAPIAQLASIHPKTVQALTEKVVSAKLKPYYDYLTARAGIDGCYAGFKLIRKESDKETDDDIKAAAKEEPIPESEAMVEAADDAPSRDADEGDTEVLYWFLMPLRAQGSAGPQIAAWETTSRSGRATYCFRLISREDAIATGDPAKTAAAIDGAIRRLNRGLLLLNFRREPIYLPDESLEMQPRYRRYAIACRKIPTLRSLRSAFLGRALHSTPQAWQQQVERLLSL